MIIRGFAFKEAVDYATARGVVLPDEYYGKLVGIQRSQATTIAGLASLEQIKRITDEVTKSIAKGGTLQSFKDAVAKGDFNPGLPEYRLDNIYRTNLQTSYNRGRWEQQQRVKGSRPYLMYDAINDGRTRPSHHAMDETILLASDPWWSTHYPPNGYKCRCTVTSLTQAQAEKRGISPIEPVDADPDEGWDYNPGEDYQAPVKAALPKAIEKAEQATKVASAALAKHQAKVMAAAKAAEDLSDLFQDPVYPSRFPARLEDLKLANPAAAKALTAQELQFLYSYTTDQYQEINGFLRSADVDDLVVNEMLTRIYDFTGKAEQVLRPGKESVYRRVNNFMTDAEAMERFGKGKTVRAKGFISTSQDQELANSFGGDYKTNLEFQISNQGAHGIDLQRIAHDPLEMEVLFAPGQGFKVDDIKKTEQGFVIKMTTLGRVKKADGEFSERFESAMEGAYLSEEAWKLWLELDKAAQ